MRLEYATSETGSWSEITATPIDFDGYPPLNRFRVNWPIADANVDRTAIAASLVFSPG